MRVLQVFSRTNEEKKFLKLPSIVYAGDPYYIPVPETAGLAELKRGEKKWKQAVFLVEQDGVPLSRCVARYCYAENEKSACIGLFESVNNMESCSLLLGEAEKWLLAQGCRAVFGPLDGDTWHRYRFVTGPWDAEPFLKEPWNPPFYPQLWEACGYKIADRYYSAQINDIAGALANFAPFLRRAMRLGYKFRQINLKKFDSELSLMHRLSTEIFSENPHYSPIELAEFIELYADARALIIPRLCQFCLSPEGDEIGFVFAYPDYAGAVRAMRGSRSIVAKLRFLLNRRRAYRVCVKTLGVLPKFHGRGVAAAMMGFVLQQILECGYKEALMCLMHEANDSRKLDGGKSAPFRNYALYKKELK